MLCKKNYMKSKWGWYCTMLSHCGTPICNLLGYRWHHSICYTWWFTTPRVVITVSPYNESWPPDVLSRGGALMSSVLNARCWPTGCLWLTLTWLFTLTIRNWLLQSRAVQSLTAGNQPARSLLASSPAGTHGHIFVQCQDFCFFLLSLFLLW
jgi:hypothetical protein